MPAPSRHKPARDATQGHAYPEHLKQSIDNLPAAPGVYTFHGQDGDLPLYIGKSVNLRSRVLSHLRNPEEARMLRQTTHISHLRTAGEIGALLLEARLIKEQHPLFNQKLRRNRQLCALRLNQAGTPEIVQSQDMDFATTPDLYGLYGSRTAALQGLRNLADAHRLCYSVLGLERLWGSRGCFRSMLGQCAGACCARESLEAHQARLQQAIASLRIACWPYPGAVGLMEHWTQDATLTQIHVLRNWCYLGSVARIEEASALTTVAAGFDADGYKVLCRPLLTGKVQAIPL